MPTAYTIKVSKSITFVRQGGINWTWFKVRNGNLVAIFRLHHGEEPLVEFNRLAKRMKEVDKIPVPDAPWREECDIVADHTTHSEGYQLPEVSKKFGWLNHLLRNTADTSERVICSEGIMRHLQYHGVYIVRI